MQLAAQKPYIFNQHKSTKYQEYILQSELKFQKENPEVYYKFIEGIQNEKLLKNQFLMPKQDQKSVIIYQFIQQRSNFLELPEEFQLLIRLKLIYFDFVENDKTRSYGEISKQSECRDMRQFLIKYQMIDKYLYDIQKMNFEFQSFQQEITEAFCKQQQNEELDGKLAAKIPQVDINISKYQSLIKDQKQQKNKFEYQCQLGLYFKKLKLFQRQEKTFQQLALNCDISKYLSKIYFRLANSYSSQQMYDQALQIYDKSYELDKEQHDILFNKALIYQSMQEYQQAIEYFNLYLQIYPGDYETQFNKGLLFYRLKQFDNGIKSYISCQPILDRHTVLEPMKFYNMGLCYYAKKDYQNSIKWIFQGIKIKNSYLTDLKNLNIYNALENSLVLDAQHTATIKMLQLQCKQLLQSDHRKKYFRIEIIKEMGQFLGQQCEKKKIVLEKEE